MTCCSLQPEDPIDESDAVFDKNSNNIINNVGGIQKLCFECLTGLVGGVVIFFISDGRDRVEHVGILWRARPRLTSVHVSEHISQNVQKRFKKKINITFFFPLKQNLGGNFFFFFVGSMYCEASHLRRCFTPFK